MLRRILIAMLAGLFAAGVVAQTGDTAPKKRSKSKTSAEARKKPAAEGDAKDQQKQEDGENAGAKAVEEIFACMAAGLPQDWRRAWVVVTELDSDAKERSFEGKFFYSLDPDGAKPAELKPCSAEDVARRVYALNDFLDFDKRRWKVATLIFNSDGKFDLTYDYAQ